MSSQETFPQKAEFLMFNRMLQAAYDSGQEVIIQLKFNACERRRGKVLDLDNECFTLFHNGSDGGIHWIFRQEDLLCCGLIVDLPDVTSTTSGNSSKQDSSQEGVWDTNIQ